MVHYVFTPWRDRRELLAVRRQFYPDGTAASWLAGDGAGGVGAPDAAAAAVARVAVWMQRGHCPHMVESTALLAAALLQEAAAYVSLETGTAAASAAAYAARAAYAAAFSRFVTGLLDGHQDRARKLSMHGLARTVGLPPAFVELRHQATHEPLPSLRRLRAGARQALAWIWQYYWVHLGGEEEEDDEDNEGNDDACRAAVAACVDAPADAAADGLASLVRQWGDARVLAALAALAADGGAAPSARTLRCMRLSRQVLQQQETQKAAAAATTSPRRRTRAETKTTEEENAADSSPARPWTAATLDLDAVRARMAEQRQALYQMGGRGEEKKEEEEEEEPPEEKDNEEDADNDVAMAGAQDTADDDDEWPAPRPRWTRYEGDWTPRPIGAVVRA